MPVRMNSIPVFTDIRPPYVVPVLSGYSRKNSSSMPKFSPDAYSYRDSPLMTRINIAELMLTVRATWLVCTCGVDMIAIPVSIKQRAVLTFVLSQEGEILVRRVMSNAQPHNTRMEARIRNRPIAWTTLADDLLTNSICFSFILVINLTPA